MGERLGSLAIGLTRARQSGGREERKAGVPLDRAAALHSISAGEPKRKRERWRESGGGGDMEGRKSRVE